VVARDDAPRGQAGEVIDLEGGVLRARAREREGEGQENPGAIWNFEIEDSTGEARTVEECLELFGRMPLPRYIRRSNASDPDRGADRLWYQTLFAREPGAVAAPTAGLHFTETLLARLAESGVVRTSITLHVGPGTFRPVSAATAEEHEMHAESYRVPESAVTAVARAVAGGNRVVAVGTTSLRALEAACDDSGRLRPSAGETRLFITPGYRFRAADALLTNFHLPRSTLLMLASAFAGRERILRLYAEAIARGYRFYSYGDAMLLLRGQQRDPESGRRSP